LLIISLPKSYILTGFTANRILILFSGNFIYFIDKNDDSEDGDTKMILMMTMMLTLKLLIYLQ